MPIKQTFFSTRTYLLSGILLVFLFCNCNAALKPIVILSLLHNLPAESPWNTAGYNETYYPLETTLSRWVKGDKLSLLHCYVTHSCQLVFTGFIWCNNIKCMAWNTWSLSLKHSSGSSYYFPNKISDNVMNIIISSISGMEHINDFALNPVQLFLNSFYFKEKGIQKIRRNVILSWLQGDSVHEYHPLCQMTHTSVRCASLAHRKPFVHVVSY